MSIFKRKKEIESGEKLPEIEPVPETTPFPETEIVPPGIIVSQAGLEEGGVADLDVLRMREWSEENEL
jgi:hypothetical protein